MLIVVNQDTVQLLNRYWSNFLGTPIGAGGTDVEIVFHSALESFSGLFVFQRMGRTIISAPPDKLRLVSLKLGGSRAVRRFDADAIRQALGPAAIGGTGPTVLNYVDAASLRTPPGPEVRPLEEEDRPELRRFLQAEEQAEVETSGLNNVQGDIFGLFLGGRLVSAAGYDVWGGSIGNICVLTSKPHRKNGYGLTTVAAAAQDGTAKGLIMQYRVGAVHEVSQHLSGRLGFSEFARSLTIDLAKKPE